MKIGLIDVDGHNFPNLALMRISAYHKAQGDEVEGWWSDFIHYDRVYMSKIFSDAYSPDKPEPMNADEVIKGGKKVNPVHYFFNDITPEEYDAILKSSQKVNQALS